MDKVFDRNIKGETSIDAVRKTNLYEFMDYLLIKKQLNTTE